MGAMGTGVKDPGARPALTFLGGAGTVTGSKFLVNTGRAARGRCVAAERPAAELPGSGR